MSARSHAYKLQGRMGEAVVRDEGAFLAMSGHVLGELFERLYPVRDEEHRPEVMLTAQRHAMSVAFAGVLPKLVVARSGDTQRGLQAVLIERVTAEVA